VHEAIGKIVSIEVTVVEQVAEFPFTSTTVPFTVFGPRSEQVKVDWEIERLETPQLSVLVTMMSFVCKLAEVGLS
jgi:hypothetical protein